MGLHYTLWLGCWHSWLFSSKPTCSGWEVEWAGQQVVGEGAGDGIVLPSLHLMGAVAEWCIISYRLLKRDDEIGLGGGCWRHIKRGATWLRQILNIYHCPCKRGQKWDTLEGRPPVRDIISRFWGDISVGRSWSPVRQSGAGRDARVLEAEAEDSLKRGGGEREGVAMRDHFDPNSRPVLPSFSDGGFEVMRLVFGIMLKKVRVPFKPSRTKWP